MPVKSTFYGRIKFTPSKSFRKTPIFETSKNATTTIMSFSIDLIFIIQNNAGGQWQPGVPLTYANVKYVLKVLVYAAARP